MKLLENKVALITGASRGIGKAIAMTFAKNGAQIAFTYLSSTEQALETEKEIAAMGVKVKCYSSDATDFSKAHELVSQVVADFGRIDILVNNAGITRDALLLRMTEDQFDEVICGNLKSVFNYMHAVVPVMKNQRSGAIVSISSVVGLGGNAGQSNYSASKAGILGLTKSLAKEYGSRGIRVNAITPGFILSDMTAQLSEETKKEWVKNIPLKRGGDVQDVANVALFLCSDLSSYLTGQVINCCGGMSIA